MEAEPTSGYLIVRSFDWMYQAFDRPAEMDQRVYSIPRRGVASNQCPKKYRGIGRNPLGLWFPDLNDGSPPPPEPEASSFLLALDEANRSAHDFIPMWEDVKEARARLKVPSNWEVIWAANCAAKVTAPPGSSLLGYEPTWFTGDHFSALSDCMCFPVWHGTDEQGELFAEHHERLNEHALFATQRDAEAFFEYYTSFDWTETGEYAIAEVRLPERQP